MISFVAVVISTLGISTQAILELELELQNCVLTAVKLYVVDSIDAFFLLAFNLAIVFLLLEMIDR